MKTEVIPVVVGALDTVKKDMVENIKKVSEKASVTETQNICMLGSAWILRQVLSVWTEWLWLMLHVHGFRPADIQTEHQQTLWRKR